MDETAAHGPLDRARRRELEFTSNGRAVTPAASSSVEAQPKTNQFVCEAQALLARHALHEQCLTELVLAAEGGPDAASSLPTLLCELGGWHDRLVRELVSLVTDCACEGELRLKQAQAQLERAEGETASLLHAAERLQQRVRAAEDTRAAALHVAKHQTQRHPRQSLRADTHVKSATPARAGAEPASPAASPSTRRDPLRPERARPAWEESAVTEAPHGDGRAMDGDVCARDSDVYARDSDGRAMEGDVCAGAVSLTSSQVTPHADRVLSLRGMREMIDELYAAKAKHNARCATDSRLRRETMEQHLYTHLNTKYGLRSLVLEHVAACVDGVRRYSERDNDVHVFGCILRNEVDEDFRLVQQQLKQTVRELLTVHLKGKLPLKGDGDIAALVRQRTSGVLQEDERTDIVLYMYAPDDATLLLARLKDKAENDSADAVSGGAAPPPIRGGKPPPPPSRRVASTPTPPRSLKLAYSSFLQVLLDFQLIGHTHFLAPFVALFRCVDTQRRGLLDEAAFRRLVASVAPQKTAAEVEELLMDVDPFNHQIVTFSDCVVALGKDLVALLSAKHQDGGAESAARG